MSTYVSISDFKNTYAISANSDAMLQEYCDLIEIEMLYKLLGKTLADLFLADASSGTPQTAIYQTIYNALQINPCYDENFSSGVNEMLKIFVYVAFNQRSPISTTTTGNKHLNSSVSDPVSSLNFYYANMYNQAVANCKVIQQYILLNMSDYPTFDGQEINFNSGF